jgi:hypothetical protein
MAITTSDSISRRVLLGASIGAVTGLVAQALGRPIGAAAQDQNLQVGHFENDASSTTGILTSTGRGFQGMSSDANGAGLYGENTAGGPGVSGACIIGDGVHGKTLSNNGVSGESPAAGKSGVHGEHAGSGYGVTGRARNGTGVFGYGFDSATAIGVRGTSPDGTGGVFKGGSAAIRLVASSGNHPASGQRGDLVVDKTGRLWFCKGGAAWSQLA